MDDKMIFQKLQKGDIIFSLERDRRALYLSLTKQGF